MENLYCSLESLETESDVEQKFLYKLFSKDSQIGLGYEDYNISTKFSIKAYSINKGKQQKTYIPDYLISLRGIPVIVAEAKNPEVDLSEAFAEAQMYANQINCKYTHNSNPCRYVIVSNGRETWFGYTDSQTPFAKLSFEDINCGNNHFTEIIDKLSKNTLLSEVDNMYITNKGKTFYASPVSELGGKNTINSEMCMNSFGSALVSRYRNIFDPQNEQDKTEIVKNAYVHSKRREQHIEPIYREIKNIQHSSLKDASLISTNKPHELAINIKTFIDEKDRQFPLLLLIGKRGSGKSTFVRYFKNKIMDDDYENLSCKCEWVFLDMNNAPLDKKLIYEWVKNKIIEKIKELYHAKIDFETIEIVEQLYGEDIKNFKKCEGKYIENNKELYNQELYNLIKALKNNSDKTLSSIVNYLKEHQKKQLVVTFDNCDKKNKEEQLLMFEVTQWLKDSFKCIIILPMRDITYDMYKNEPPLDTFVRDLVFRIDTPDLFKVLISRLEYIERINKATKEKHYSLDNDIQVRIKPEELIDYYRQILHVVRTDDWAKNIFYRLSNGDLRYAIQLFEDLCKSGHINTSEILGMKLLGTEFKMPSHKIMNALLRKNRKYYDELNSNFVNVFSSDFKDDIPDPFVRLDILYWLSMQKNTLGTNGILGFHHIKKLIKDLEMYGHKQEVIFRELKFLINKGLILEENLTDDVNIEDLVKISTSGSLHLKLLKNLSYLSACSEATLYHNTEIKGSIGKRLASSCHLSLKTQVQNAIEMLDYLIGYRKQYFAEPSIYMKEAEIAEQYKLEESKSVIANMDKDYQETQQCINSIVDCIIRQCQKKSILLTFNNDKRGFLAVNEASSNLSETKYLELKVDDTVKCKVLSYDENYNSYKMMLIAN